MRKILIAVSIGVSMMICFNYAFAILSGHGWNDFNQYPRPPISRPYPRGNAVSNEVSSSDEEASYDIAGMPRSPVTTPEETATEVSEPSPQIDTIIKPQAVNRSGIQPSVEPLPTATVSQETLYDSSSFSPSIQSVLPTSYSQIEGYPPGYFSEIMIPQWGGEILPNCILSCFYEPPGYYQPSGNAGYFLPNDLPLVLYDPSGSVGYALPNVPPPLFYTPPYPRYAPTYVGGTLPVFYQY